VLEVDTKYFIRITGVILFLGGTRQQFGCVGLTPILFDGMMNVA
jgi:hypothetical protein